ncbi:glycosyltransferase [soil metagenome]
MRFLFVKHVLAWPRSSGHDVHSYHMMKALADLGHQIALVTVDEPVTEAIAGLPLMLRHAIGAERTSGIVSPLTGLRERYRSYWGIEPARIEAVARAAVDFAADAVVVVGLDVLPYLGAVEEAQRVWYAADEWVWHHLSQVRPAVPSTWGELNAAAVKGLHERAYAPLLDRVWVVSKTDRRAMRLALGHDRIDVVPNGIDLEHFRPIVGEVSELPRSCVFWGRLDFGPNIQALQWFCRRVWPAVRREVPDATFTIYGFRPTDPVWTLAGRDGVVLIPDLPDLRSEIARHQIVVLPFVSGGGIKNKLLEASAMARPILCTPRASNGLHDAVGTLVRARSADRWVRELLALWDDPERRHHLGSAARDWVVSTHTWEAAAGVAAASLESPSRQQSGPRPRGAPVPGQGIG